MPTDVVMPQMGESIAEGTIVRWIKKVGDSIDRDEPLFEISTDKVDAEIPSPGEGVLLEIKVNEGETVPVNSVVAVIGAPGAAVAQVPPAAVPAPPAEAFGSVRRTASSGAEVPPAGRRRTSPVVRKMAREHDLDLSGITGTGIAGRVTRHDVVRHLEQARGRQPAAAPPPAAPPSALQTGEDVRVEKMSVMRRKIAEHMVASMRTSPHVYRSLRSTSTAWSSCDGTGGRRTNRPGRS